MLPLQEPVPGWQTTQPKPLLHVSAGTRAAQLVVVSVPLLQIWATLPWQVTPLGEHAAPPSPVVESAPPLPSPGLASGPKNESGNAMSSVASPLPPPLLVLLPVVASSPKEPLLLPLPLVLPPLLVLPPDELSAPGPESPRSKAAPPPELPQPTAIAPPRVAKEAQRSQMRTNDLRGFPRP
jgi:hypothetical protein